MGRTTNHDNMGILKRTYQRLNRSNRVIKIIAFHTYFLSDNVMSATSNCIELSNLGERNNAGCLKIHDADDSLKDFRKREKCSTRHESLRNVAINRLENCSITSCFAHVLRNSIFRDEIHFSNGPICLIKFVRERGRCIYR